MYENNLDFAKKLDSQDKLAKYRGEFHFPTNDAGEPLLYFTGNSLGLMPKHTQEAVQVELDDWKKYGVEAHFMGRNPWKDYHEFVTDSLAKLVGAKTDEVVAMGTLTSNLNSLLVSFYRPSSKRNKIMIEGTAFPSDIYSVASHITLHGLNPDDCLIKLYPKEGANKIETSDILQAIEDNKDTLAVVMLGAVNYYSGQYFDLKSITAKAHEYGIYAGFDLAHTIGNVKPELHDWDVDFAMWCTYKYLNSGPGATAGIFVHNKFAERFDIPRLAGWWGHDKADRFKMGSEFKPMRGAEGWQNSNPAILPLACLKASLSIFDEVGIENLREKSLLLTGYLEYLLNDLNNSAIEIITPKEANERGCQISIRVKNANKELFNELTKKGVISDWREPDVVRVAPVPLYNSFEDVFRFVEILKSCLH